MQNMGIVQEAIYFQENSACSRIGYAKGVERKASVFRQLARGRRHYQNLLKDFNKTLGEVECTYVR